MTDLVERLRAVVAWVKRAAPTSWRDEITYDDIEAVALAADEIVRLRQALRIIAGDEQCIDNLLSDKEIARQALSGDTP